MNKLLIALFIFIASCGGIHKTPHLTSGDPNCQIYEQEPNNNIHRATYVTTLLASAQPEQFCGNFDNFYDVDFYHFSTYTDEMVSFVLMSDDSDTTFEAFLVANDISNGTTYMLGHFFGDRGILYIEDFPVFIADDGFHLVVKSPTYSTGLYHVEIWSPGILVP